jgi:hypothetical protein
MVKVILDPEAVGNGAGILVDLCLEGGDAPGQVVRDAVYWAWFKSG